MTQKDEEREQFIAILQKELPAVDSGTVYRAARLLMRHAATHGRLAEESCNGYPTQGSPSMPIECINKLQNAWDARISKKKKQIEARMSAIAAELGLGIDFGGDPRGYTVKVFLPSKRYNTWGGEESGWGVPQ